MPGQGLPNRLSRRQVPDVQQIMLRHRQQDLAVSKDGALAGRPFSHLVLEAAWP